MTVLRWTFHLDPVRLRICNPARLTPTHLWRCERGYPRLIGIHGNAYVTILYPATTSTGVGLIGRGGDDDSCWPESALRTRARL